MKALLITPYPQAGKENRSAVANYAQALTRELSAGGTTVAVCSPTLGLRGFRDALRAARREKPDVIHVQHELFLFGGVATIVAFPFFLALLSRIARTVVTLHHVAGNKDLTRSFNTLHATRIPTPLVRLGLHYLYRGMARGRAGAFIVHHAYFSDILHRQYGVPARKIYVIPHGQKQPGTVMLSHAELHMKFGIPQGKKMIFGFFGYIDPRKHIEFMIREFAAFAETAPDAFLLIAGDKHPRLAGTPAYEEFFATVRAFARHYPQHIRWCDHVPDEDVDALYQAIDCMILPYGESAGMSSVLTDMLGSGKKYIVSDSLAPFSETAHGIFPIRVGELERCLRAFVESSNVATGGTKTGTHSWKESAERTRMLYGLLTDRRHGRDGILVIGAYGQENLGDELLLASCMHRLQKDRCTVVTRDPAGTALRFGVRTIDRRSVWRIAAATLRSTDIVVGGGDHFKLLKRSTGRHAYSLLTQTLLISLLARAAGVRVHFLGVGIGNVSTPLATRLTRSILRCATTVVLRDGVSAAWCRANAPGVEAVHGADLSFLILSHENARATSTTLAIAPTFQLDHPTSYDRVLDAIAGAAESFLASDERRTVTLLPFQFTTEHHGDITVCGELLARMKSVHRASIRGDLNAPHATDVYGDIDMIWGMRLHSLLVACQRGVPFIALVYDEKVRHFLKEIDYERWGMELDNALSAEALASLHARLERERDAVGAHLLTQAALMRERAERGLRALPASILR